MTNAVIERWESVIAGYRRDPGLSPVVLALADEIERLCNNRDELVSDYAKLLAGCVRLAAENDRREAQALAWKDAYETGHLESSRLAAENATLRTENDLFKAHIEPSAKMILSMAERLEPLRAENAALRAELAERKSSTPDHRRVAMDICDMAEEVRADAELGRVRRAQVCRECAHPHVSKRSQLLVCPKIRCSVGDEFWCANWEAKP